MGRFPYLFHCTPNPISGPLSAPLSRQAWDGVYVQHFAAGRAEAAPGRDSALASEVPLEQFPRQTLALFAQHH
jgi:hypothetical protein